MPNKILQLETPQIIEGVTVEYLFPFRLDAETYRPNGVNPPYLTVYIDAANASGTEFKDGDGKARYLKPIKLDFLFDTMPDDIKTKHRDLVNALLELAVTREMLPAGTVEDAV